MTKTELVNKYIELAFTDHYIFGYAENHKVFGARVFHADDILEAITSTDRASQKNGGTLQLKYKPNKNQVEIIKRVSTEIKYICTVEELEEMNANRPQNRGQIFEELVAEKWNGTQNTTKNAKFTDAEDVQIGRYGYQVKYLKATFTDERTLANLTK